MMALTKRTTIETNDPLQLLGFVMQDRVTSFRGVVTSISFDLYGCIQAVVQPTQATDGAIPEGRWFDIGRLAFVPNYARVMTPPHFTAGDKGPAEKPLP